MKTAQQAYREYCADWNMMMDCSGTVASINGYKIEYVYLTKKKKIQIEWIEMQITMSEIK